MLPNHLILAAPSATPRCTTLVIHGILGSLTNWRGFVRGLLDGRLGGEAAARAAESKWLLVDLRGHGESPVVAGPHTVDACADDLAELSRHLGVSFERVVGHSFGGKVAARLAARHGVGAEEVWLLDSPPGPSADGSPARAEIARVLAALRALAAGGSLPGRVEVAAALRALGMSDALAQWMTTNVRGSAAEGYRWKFDLDVVEALVADYFALDVEPWLGDPPPGIRTRLVIGGRSDRFDPTERERLAARLRVDVLPEAGHWLHVDDPAGVAALLS